MSGLTQNDLQVLDFYAQHKNRERYWNYLANIHGNDGYGELALGVVRNDNMPGATANAFAQQYVEAHPINGKKHLTEREWEKVGVDLIKEDLKQRHANFNNGSPDLALNLPVENVYHSHKVAFEKNGIDQHAWTPSALMDASYNKTRSFKENNEMWHEMLDSSRLGINRGWHTFARQHNLDNGHLRAGYFSDAQSAWLEGTQSLNYTNPSKIGFKDDYYEKTHGHWARYQNIPTGPDKGLNVEPVDNLLNGQLDDGSMIRQHRLNIRNDKHPSDPNNSITQSKHTIAVNEPLQTPLTVASISDLSPHNQKLHASVKEYIHELYKEHGLPIDKGTENTVMHMTLAASKEGVLSVGQSAVRGNDVVLVERRNEVATIIRANGVEAANMSSEQSLQHLVTLDQKQIETKQMGTIQALNQPQSKGISL